MMPGQQPPDLDELAVKHRMTDELPVRTSRCTRARTSSAAESLAT